MADVTFKVDEATGRAAFLTNSHGDDVVVVKRLAQRDADGMVVDMSDTLPLDNPRSHATTDEQWQGIVDLIAAAPEMLAVLKRARQHLSAHLPVGEWQTFEDVIANIDHVLAKAEPVREVRRTVVVEVEVTLDVEVGTDDESLAMIAVDTVRDGGGTVVKHVVTK
jgi:hypothetical protein